MPISCVQVQADGSVTLRFYPLVPGGLGTFDFLDIYFSNVKTGLYTNFAAPNNSNPSNLVLTGASVPLPAFGANAEPYYFYTVVNYTENGIPNTVASDTVSSIYLTASFANEGYSNLTWNPIRTPLSPTSNTDYDVKRSFYEYNLPISGTSLSGSTPSTFFTDTLIGKCDDSVFYSIEILDNLSGCVSRSNITRNTFTTSGPEAPVITFATIKGVNNPNERGTVNWLPSISNFTDGYIVYKLICSGPAAVDTLLNINNTIWTDYDTLIGCETCMSYRVASYFDCNSFLDPTNASDYLKIGEPGLFHNAIEISETFDPCTYEANINWCKYKSWNSGVKEYKIYVGKNGAIPSVVATVDATQSSYIYKTGTDVAIYTMYITAEDNSGNYTSTSDIDTIYARVPRQPKEVYLRYVSVLPDGRVEGMFTNDTLASVDYYEVWRAEAQEGPFEDKVGDINFNLHKDTLKFKDTLLLTNEMSYYYRVQTVDSCGNKTIVSNQAKTILLQANPELNFSSEMSWSLYEGWPSGTNYHEIYRSYSNRFEETLVQKQLLDSGISYIDGYSDSLNPDGFYCYRVMAVGIYDTLHYTIDSSYSNFVCIRQTPHIFVPNAFTPPDGYNPIFKPIFAFVSKEDYELKVYDRLGLEVCKVNELEQGWDGKYRGVDSPIGVYWWQLKYKNLKKEFKYLKGTVTLVR